MSPDKKARPFLRDGMPAVLVISIAGFLLHLLLNGRYGYFRDEFDYIICGRHPAWGYVDHPPLLPILSRICISIFGDSLRSIRLIPAVSSAALVLGSGLIARELGGKRFAVVLTAFTVLIAPVYLSGGTLLTTNCDLEPLLWMSCAYCAILAVRRNAPQYWLLFGIVAGIGFQEKYSIAIFGISVLTGLMLTPERRLLLSRWALFGGIAALIVILPNLIWNFHHAWPFLQLMQNIKASGRDVVLSPWEYFRQQLLLISPASAPVWITGVIAFLFALRFKSCRFLGWTYLVSFTLFVALKGKNYYLAPVYPLFLAGGSIVIDEWANRIRQFWLKPAILALALAGGIILAPLTVPLLPIDQFLAYMNRIPIKVPRSEHSHERAALPQHYADQFGWSEIVAKTAEAWNRIPADIRKSCGVFAQDYGQAGAIDFFGPRYGLPPALSGHQTWWIWGPRGYSGNCMVILDDNLKNLQQAYETVEYLGNSAPNRYALESEIPVYICRGSKFGTLEAIWPKLKHWR